jgi:murein L,D-transpeptidase YafK
MKTLLLTIVVSVLSTPTFAVVIKELRVAKGERKLELITEDDQVYKTYKVMLGLNAEGGAKSQDGDNKTPEGTYTLDLKNEHSKFHKAFHISYPSARDTWRARLHGKKPGGDIMLHGYPNTFEEMREWLTSVNLDKFPEETIRANLSRYDWTNGCIAVTDAEIDEIFSIVDVPTKIIINP